MDSGKLVCNCAVGFYDGEIIVLDDLDRFFEYNMQIVNLIKFYYGKKGGYIRTKADFFKTYKHYFFAFCPNCGIKIRWRSILGSPYKNAGHVGRIKERLKNE